MQQFYYLAVLFVAGGIGSALIVAADLRTRRQPMRIMESVWVLTALWASFFGLWAYFALGRATRHMPVQNNGTGKQKDSAKISEPAKGGGIGETGNERQVDSAGQKVGNEKPGTDGRGGGLGPEAANGKPGTDGRKDMSVAGTDLWKVSEPERAMNMPEPGMHGMQMENGTTTGADGAEDMPGMKGTALKAGMADEAGIPDMASGASMPGMADGTDMPGMTNGTKMSGTAGPRGMEGMDGMDGMSDMPGMKGAADKADTANGADMPGMADGTKMSGTAGPRGMEGMDGMDGMDGMSDMPGMKGRPRWQSVVLSTLHCGAGCTLADIVGEWFLFFVPVAIGGSILAGTWVVDYLLALAFGIGFQYAAIRGMERTLPRGEAIRRAAKADILSLTAWQAGMYGWMAVAIFALNGGEAMPRTSFVFWFSMQVAMACGFLVALPVNILLIRAGIKKGM
ncbi:MULTISPECIES: DUF4396 domain-containing protein [Alistipes]|uniref:DUF4396 domain-containing protein n=1 Tax=Alistipes TaxID=239759 RepID=UPI00036349E7|nr:MULTISPECIES: DUF4396 domain-containing protein [Alistipes]MDR3785315.1 DUF4396 domain-containing protein [Alistipes sp.]UWN61513.1 DUF4396 domain-containing protein [Alistipes onderdonkii]BDE91807.1 hypothetical protein CE91St18_25390 [Alistipes onderdonkii]GKG97021.1 hypothetical protein CE91St17_20830 [Alistipes onderdonkii]